MSVWVEELKDWVSEEELEVIKELLEEEKKIRKEKKKRELLGKYKDKFSSELKARYGVQ
jgi:hypothetical protein